MRIQIHRKAAKMIKFAIPYNSELETTKAIIRKYKRRIEEIYFAIDLNIAAVSMPPLRAISADESRRLVRILKKNKIKSNILINGIYQGNRDPERMKDFIRSIGGVDGITVADRGLLEVFKDFGSRMHISRIAQLNSAEQIRRILTRYPDLTITIENDTNRDLAELKKIYSLKKDFPNFKVKLMVNEGCLLYCTGRTRHSWLACMSKTEKKYLKDFGCRYQIIPSEIDKEMIKSPFIRPEDLFFYEQNNTVDIFKIAGREKRGKELLRIVDAYMNGDYQGPLAALMRVMPTFLKINPFGIENKKFPKDFVKKVTRCDKFCAGCTYCGDIARKVMVIPRKI